MPPSSVSRRYGFIVWAKLRAFSVVLNGNKIPCYPFTFCLLIWRWLNDFLQKHPPFKRFPQNISKLRDTSWGHYSYRTPATPLILTPVLQIETSLKTMQFQCLYCPCVLRQFINPTRSVFGVYNLMRIYTVSFVNLERVGLCCSLPIQMSFIPT
jgi:hypothetical protein